MSFKNLAAFLNSRFTDSPVWAQLAQSTQDVLNSAIGLGTDELLRIRDPILWRRGDSIQTIYGFGTVSAVFSQSPDGSGADQIYVDVPNVGTVVVPISQYQDRVWLIKNAAQIGFDYFSTNITNADYARMVEYLAMYWPQSGSTNNLSQFIGFVQSLNIQIQQLWAPNDGQPTYTSLVSFNSDPINGTTPVWQGGNYYPTSSVEVLYDVFDGSISLEEIQSLFFLLAPVHLVLSRLAGLAQTYFNLSAIVVSAESTIENGTDQEDFTFTNNTFEYNILQGYSSQVLLFPNTTRVFWSISNTSGAMLWISELGPATCSSPSLALYPGKLYTSLEYGCWTGAIFITGPVTGQTFTVTERSNGPDTNVNFYGSDDGIGNFIIGVSAIGE